MGGMFQLEHNRRMFNRASAFNGDISNWNTATVTNMAFTFLQATSFNQELCWSLKEGVDQTRIFDGSLVDRLTAPSFTI
jgi:surface protein